MIGFGRLQAGAAPQGRMKGSSVFSTPLTTGCPSRTLSVSPGPATIRLMKFWLDSASVGVGQACVGRVRGAAFVPLSAPAGGWKTTMSPIDGVGEVVEEAVDEDPLADVERRLHRLRGDLVGLDQPGLNRQRQPQRQGDDDDQLDKPAASALRLRDREFQAESSPESPESSGSSSSASCAAAVSSVSPASGASASVPAAPLPLLLPPPRRASACARRLGSASAASGPRVLGLDCLGSW